MSYSIYKKIKQNKDGSFDCVVASNNLTTRTGGYVWEDYHMTYFNDKYPDASNALKRAIFLIVCVYCGDQFYPAAWHEDLEIAGIWEGRVDLDYSKFCNDSTYALKMADDFNKFLNEMKKANRTEKHMIKLKDGRFVYKFTKDGGAKVVNCAEKATIFNGCREFLENKCFFIKKYIDNFIKVC